MGRSRSLRLAVFTGARIAGKHDPNTPPHMMYVPAHTKNGVFISQRANFSAYANEGAKKGAEAKKEDAFDFVAWGKLADSMCRMCSVGRAFDLFATPQPFLKPITDAAGNPVMTRSGAQLRVNTVNFRVDRLVPGEESAEVIAREVANNERPADWDDRGTAGYVHFRQVICAARNVEMPNYATMTYRNARIFIPQGVGIQLVDPETRQPIAATAAAPVATVPGVAAAVGAVMPAAQVPPIGYAYNSLGQLVQLANPAAPVAAPAAAPVAAPFVAAAAPAPVVAAPPVVAPVVAAPVMAAAPAGAVY